jgi:hypothetical protein
MSPIACDPQEVQAVKDALLQNDLNLGVGILHEPTGQVRLCPIDSLPNRGGHAEFAGVLGLPLAECKGFVIGKQGDAFVPVNLSHLNGPQGQPGSLQMPAATFADIVRALRAAGL